MLISVFFGPAFLTASSVFSLVQIETKHATPSTPFPSFTNDTVIEVIRNISRVNNDLQELVKNYEKFQKTYKTQSFESHDDYSTDSEIDERYKYAKSKKKNIAKVNTDKPFDKFPATQLNAFQDSVESGASENDSVEDNKSERSSSDANNHDRLSTKENLKAHIFFNYGIKSDSSDSSISEEVFIKENMQTTTDKPPEIIFVNTHKILNKTSKPTHSPQAKIEPIIHEQKTTPSQKTRYEKVDYRNDLRSGDISINVSSVPKTNKSRMVVHAESFPREKMWDEISKNVPIKIQEDEAYYRSKTNNETEVIGSMKRLEKNSHHGNVPNDSEQHRFNKAAHSGSQPTNNKDSDSDADSAEEEKELNKEIFKTHVLRKAYGDSCTKLVVRKCFKACKAAAKRACSGSNCKSSFKESFLNYSKVSCTKQFDSSKSQAKVEQISELYRRSGINFPDDDYWMAACWPLMRSDKPTVPKRKLNSTSLKPEEQMNILRDRYEKACQSASAGKCNTACVHSYDSACKTTKCPRKRGNYFRKQCKRECRDVFKRSRNSGSSKSHASDSSGSDSSVSDSGSDSGSASGSDSGSDSGSGSS